MQKNIWRIITLCNNIAKAEKLCPRDQVKNRAGRVIGKIPAEDNTVSMALLSFDKGEEISTTSRERHKTRVRVDFTVDVRRLSSPRARDLALRGTFRTQYMAKNDIKRS